MRILNISNDKKVADKNSLVAKRIVEYGELVEQYTVVVLSEIKKEIDLSGKVKIIIVKKGSLKILNLRKLKKKLKEIINQEKYDVITVQDAYFIGWIALKLAKKFKMGMEVQIHGFEKFYGLRKWIAKYVLRKANAVRVVSQRLKKQLVREFNVEENKITVIPIYTELRSMKYEVRSMKSDKFIFLTVGRLVPVKNIEMQIKAMNEVVKKHNNVKLWIIGDGPQQKALQVRCQTRSWPGSGMSDVKCHFWGWRDELDKFYEQADAFLLTSNYEGWGLAVVEAANYGLPIIMTDVGLAGEVIKDDESGIIIPVGDQKRLEEEMCRFIEDEELRKRLGQDARRAVEQLPDKKQTLELYKKSWEKALEIRNK